MPETRADVILGEADRARLGLRAVGGHDHAIEARLDPEARGQIGEVREQHQHGHARARLPHRVAHDAVEVGHHREHHRGRIRREMPGEGRDQRASPHRDGQMEQAEERAQEQRPAAAKDDVVALLERQPRGLLHHVQGRQHFLQVRDAEAPGAALFLPGGQKRVGRRAMAPAGVDGQEKHLRRVVRRAQGRPSSARRREAKR